MNVEVFKYRFIVPREAIDELNHVNNITYLQWFLDSAGKHWKAKSNESLQKRFFWIVLDHSISYKQPAFEGDEVEIQTWVESYQGVRSVRCYKMIRVTDNKILTEAKTTWCLIDGKTKKPTIISTEISNLFQE